MAWKRKDVAIIAGLVASALVLLWGALRTPAGAFDDAFITYRYADNLRRGLGLTYNAGEWVLGTTTPLFALLLGGLGLLVANMAWLGHWVGVLSWVGSVWMALAFFRQEERPAVGLVAALLLAVQPALLDSVGMETPFLVLLMLALAWAWFGRRRWLAVVLAAALILTRQDSAFWLLFLGLEVWRRERRLPWQEAAGTVLLTLPWFLYAQWRYGNFLPNSAAAKIGQTALMPVPGLPSFPRGLLETVTAGLPLAAVVALAIGVVLGLWVVWRSGRRFWWLPAWLVAYVLFYSAAGVVTFPWYFVPGVVGVMMLAALGIGELVAGGEWQVADSRWHILVGLLLLLVLLAGYGPAVYAASEREHGYQPAYVPAGRWLAENTPPEATVATIEIGVVGYESRRPVVDTMGLVTPDMTTHQLGWQETLVYALNAHRPDYALTLPGTAWDGIVTEWWFAREYRPAATFDNVTLYERRPDRAIDYQLPLDVPLANGITLTGLSLPDQRLPPGATIYAEVALAVDAPQETNYLLTLFLVDAQSLERYGTTTVEPFSGRYPGLVWQPGDRLQIPARLDVPAELPAGAYRLGIILYDVAREAALSLRDGPAGEPADVQAGWLRLGRPQSPAPLPAALVAGRATRWEEGIVLESAMLPAQAVRPGGVLPLQLSWRATAMPTRDLTLFVHLVDGQGEIVAQQDGKPFAGRWPTPVWQSGERLTDEVLLTLPEGLPAGQYGLRIGWYDAAGRVLRPGGEGDSLWLVDVVRVE